MKIKEKNYTVSPGNEMLIDEYAEEFDLTPRAIQNLIYRALMSAEGYDLLHKIFKEEGETIRKKFDNK